MNAGAFYGDPAPKRALLDTIDRHQAAGTLVFDGTVWDGLRGSPLGIAIEGDDPAAYAQRYGVPLPLAALLDPLMLSIPDDRLPAQYVRDWVEAIEPGADLAAVPSRLVLRMLATPEAQGVDDELAERLAALHRRDAEGVPPPRDAWTAVQHAILCRAVPDADTVQATALGLWEACSWSARRGRSVLVLAFAKWAPLRARGATGNWSAEDAERARTTLQTLWDEQAPARAADTAIDYPALFEARDPLLAAGFVAHLTRTNARFLESGTILADWCLACFGEAAPVRVRA